MRKNNNLTPEQMKAMATEWNQRLIDFPAVKNQLKSKADTTVSKDIITDQDITDLENAFQCVIDSLDYYPSRISTYIKKCAKIPDLDTAENLEIQRSIRDQAEILISEIKEMKESSQRTIRFRQLANGIYISANKETEPSSEASKAEE